MRKDAVQKYANAKGILQQYRRCDRLTVHPAKHFLHQCDQHPAHASMLIKDGFLRTEHEIAGLYQSEASARYGSSLSTQRAVYIKEASVGMVSRAGRSHTEANPCPRARFQNVPHAVSDSAVTMMICNHETRYQMMTLEAALLFVYSSPLEATYQQSGAQKQDFCMQASERLHFQRAGRCSLS